MGLDITHIKLIEQKSDASTLILKGELEHCLMDYDLKDISFTQQEVEGIWEPIVIFTSSKEMDLLQPTMNELSDGYCLYELFLHLEMDNLDALISAFEQRKGLDKLIKKDNFVEYEEDGQLVSYVSVSYEGVLMKEVVYGIEQGYQRKGMKRAFYEYFKNDMYYMKKEYFEKLLEFRDEDSHTYHEKNIEANFLANFESGKSILSVSW